LDKNKIFSIIVEQIYIVCPNLVGTPIDPNDQMSELGIDSVDRQEIIILVLEVIGLELPMVQLHGPKNLGELADLLFIKCGA
jgi:polyketide biosynthesis acyl carrier protein